MDPDRKPDLYNKRSLEGATMMMNVKGLLLVCCCSAVRPALMREETRLGAKTLN